MKSAALLLVVLTVLAFILFWKRRRETTKGLWFRNAVMTAFTAAYTGFVWYFSVKSLRAYYMLGAVLALAVLLQIIGTAAGTLMWKHEV